MTFVDPFYDALVRSGPHDRLIGPEDIVAGLLRRPEWHQRAACQGRLNDFYPERGQSLGPARSLCADCPVTSECAEASDDHGVWGGLTVNERRSRRSDHASEDRPDHAEYG